MSAQRAEIESDILQLEQLKTIGVLPVVLADASIAALRAQLAMLNRVGFQFKIRPDRLAEYKQHHKHVWPEMLDALRETGWHNYTLFMRADGLIFGYFETEESLTVAQAAMAAKDVNTRWQEFMSPFVDANARPDETFIELEEYFHLD